VVEDDIENRNSGEFLEMGLSFKKN